MTLVQIISSCSKDKNNLHQKNLAVFASKHLLLSLPLEEQKQAWLTRLEMYQNLDFSPAQKQILKKIIFDSLEMEKDKFYLSENLRNDAVSMAKITSQDDFINLFCEVTSSLPILNSTGPVCADYIIADLKTDVGQSSNSNVQVEYRTPNCDCNWTCGQQAEHCPGESTTLSSCIGVNSGGSCTAVGGCGLFDMGTYTGLVICEDH